MNKLISLFWAVVVGLVVLCAIGPIVLAMLRAAVPVIALLAVAACIVRLVWHYTGGF